MRFLQGSANGGIPCVRGPYVRPLLWTDRTTIEEYLNSKKIGWRTDSTNSNTAYLRNRIRNNLIPLLNKDFAGWDNAVLLGLEKENADASYIQKQAEEFYNMRRSLSQSKGPDVSIDCVSFPGADFYSLDRAIKLRVLTLAMNALGLSERIPYVFLRDICECAANYKEESSESETKEETSSQNIISEDNNSTKNINKNGLIKVKFDFGEGIIYKTNIKKQILKDQ